VSVGSLPTDKRAARAAQAPRNAAENYASSLLARPKRPQPGCGQVVSSKRSSQRWIAELGGMKSSSSSMTARCYAAAGRQIPPGLTRGSRLTLAKDKGIKVSEDALDRHGGLTHDSGRPARVPSLRPAVPPPLTVVTPIGTVAARMASSSIGTAGPGPRPEN